MSVFPISIPRNVQIVFQLSDGTHTHVCSENGREWPEIDAMGTRLTPIVLGMTALTLAFATAAITREYQITIKPLEVHEPARVVRLLPLSS